MSFSAERSEVRLAASAEYDKPKEACGVFGIYAPGIHQARIVYCGLQELQHRGQEGAGIYVSTGEEFCYYKGVGLVEQVFTDDYIDQLDGSTSGVFPVLALGHTRYSTTGASRKENVGPVHSNDKKIAVAHNGNLTNAPILRYRLEQQGFAPESSTDSELIAELISQAQGRNLGEKVRNTMPLLRGSYAMVVASFNEMVAIRDPMGNRPLSIGKIDDGWIVASETAAIENVGGEVVRDVASGEICNVMPWGARTEYKVEVTREAFCSFEFHYLARPDSLLYRQTVHEIRSRFGQVLARVGPVDADYIVAVPDNARPISEGFSEVSGIPVREAILRNRYWPHRNFMRALQEEREDGNSRKYRFLPYLIQGKRLVITDDSIIRGTTTRALVRKLRRLGAREIHLRISFPRVEHPCFYGVDMQTYKELIASGKTTDQIRDFLGADSLVYLTVEQMIEATKVSDNKLCTACITGVYPEEIGDHVGKHVFELKRPRILSTVR